MEPYFSVISVNVKVNFQKQDEAAVQAELISDADRNLSSDRSGADFLLSLAGMFDSGTNTAVEKANTIVSHFIREKYGYIH